MAEVDLAEAQEHFVELVARAEKGEEIVIARDGLPVAFLLPVARRTPIFGLDEGVFTVPDDFDEMSEDEIALFESDGLTL
ncbi:MAG TPA: type II toxin-antitoxin system prevent-host-death family antitoxin [Tepidiformaceae bacterium]|nr:type II toxin-antitoxin system prevent-host-death family antitoxin [Tepidiformaceae bacterium]